MSADRACSSFTPRSERDVTNCACGWSAAAHLPPEERPPMVPFIEVSWFTEMGVTMRARRPIRVF